MSFFIKSILACSSFQKAEDFFLLFDKQYYKIKCHKEFKLRRNWICIHMLKEIKIWNSCFSKYHNNTYSWKQTIFNLKGLLIWPYHASIEMLLKHSSQLNKSSTHLHIVSNLTLPKMYWTQNVLKSIRNHTYNEIITLTTSWWWMYLPLASCWRVHAQRKIWTVSLHGT